MQGLQFLQQNNIEHKSATSTEAVVKVCPFCGDDRYKLYVNKDTGLYDCKLCGQQGNLYQLKAKYGHLDEISSGSSELNKKYKPLSTQTLKEGIVKLWSNDDALNYLRNKRKFTDETIRHFKLGLNGDVIMIPHIYKKKLWNFKMRNYLEKRFTRVKGQPTVLFNADNLDTSKKAVVIVESETDAMAAWQMGIENVVALTGGAQTFKPEWIPIFNEYKTVYIVLNSDEAGQKGAQRVAEKIGYPKCLNVILPTKDVNDYLIEGKEDFFKFVKDNATKFSIQNVTQMSDYVSSIDDFFDGEGSMSGLEITSFPRLDAVLKGFKGEDLIIFSGDSGVGKTTWTLNVLNSFLENDHKCLAFCLEGKIQYYILRMMSAHKNMKYEDLRSNETEWEILKDEFSEYEMYFYSGSQADMSPKKMRELLPAAVKLYDIEFVVIDNLQKFVRGVTDVPARTSDAISTLKDLAVDLKIPILLISHITKRDPHSKAPITMHDSKSSSTIYQDADVYLIINTDSDGNYRLTVEKNRMGEGGIDIPIELNKETAKYIELADDFVPKKKEKIERKKAEKIEDVDNENFEVGWD